MTHHEERNGGRLVLDVTHHTGLYLQSVSPCRDDEEMRTYALGVRHGLSFSQAEDALEMGTRRAREAGVETVVDVIVELADGPREFTWTEFRAWTDTTEVD